MEWTRLATQTKSLPRTRGLREVICDTSPLLYLHQIKQLELLRELSSGVVVPPCQAVVENRNRVVALQRERQHLCLTTTQISD